MRFWSSDELQNVGSQPDKENETRDLFTNFMVSDVTEMQSNMNVCVQNLRMYFEDQEIQIRS